MDKEVVNIYDIKDRAIIESFSKLNADSLQRKVIIKKSHELSGESEANLAKRIKKLVDEGYLIKVERSKRERDTIKRRPGIYKLNNHYNFVFGGEPLASETKPAEVQFKSAETPVSRREKHTAALYPAIGAWIDYFPIPPDSGDSRKFFRDIKLCEQHPLYPDLVNHLPQSDFDVCDRWEQYKAGVKEIDMMKGELLKQIESDISEIFGGLKLRYVRSWEYLKDYDCYLPTLILECILNAKKSIGLKDIKLEKAQTEEEYEKIESELEEEEFGPDYMAGYIEKMDFIEIGDSILGGLSGYIKFIMIPKKDKDVLIQGKDKAASYLLRPPAEIDKKAEAIMKKVALLYQEREYIITELNRSTHCLSFSGDCRYLGSGPD